MLFWLTIFISSIFLDNAQAYTLFETTCSLPNSTVNYVASPNTRGSLDIAWSCWATLIACVYSLVHLNVPRHGTTMQQLEHVGWCIFCLFLPEYIYGICIAEFLIARRHQNEIRAMILASGAKDREAVANEWTLTHLFYANMGGFVLRHRIPGGATKRRTADAGDYLEETKGASSREKDDALNAVDQLDIVDSSTDAPSSAHRGQENTVYDTKNNDENQPVMAPSIRRQRDAGLVVATKDSSEDVACVLTNLDQAGVEEGNTSQLRGLDRSEEGYRSFHLNAAVLKTAIKNGHLSARAVPKDDIADRSKFDWFARLITILQLTDFFTNVVARVVERLPIAPAEVAVCAFAVCSIIAYLVIWAKPKDAATTIVLQTYEEEEVPKPIQEYMTRYRKTDSNLDCGSDLEPDECVAISRPDPYMLALGLQIDTPLQAVISLGGGSLIGTVFSAIHLAGWNLYFPSTADQWLWRAAAISTTLLPGAFFLGVLLISAIGGFAAMLNPFLWNQITTGKGMDITPREHAPKRPKSVPKKAFFGFISVSATIVLGISYGGGRLILLVEMIRTLFYLHPDTFITPSWSVDIPHIS